MNFCFLNTVFLDRTWSHRPGAPSLGLFAIFSSVKVSDYISIVLGPLQSFVLCTQAWQAWTGQNFINAKYFPLFVVPNSNSCQSVGNSVFWYFTWGFEEQKVPQAQQNFCSLMGTLLRNIFGTFATYFHWNKLVIFRCTSTLWERSILFCLCLCMKIQFNSLIFIMFNKLWAFNFAFGKNVQALLFENISDGKATSLCFMTRHQNKSNFFFFAFAWTFSSLHFDIVTFQIL